MILVPGTAAAWFLAAGVLLGTGIGWRLRLRLPVQPRTRGMLPLPVTPRRRSSVQGLRRSLALLGFSLALLCAVLGILTGAAILREPSAALVLPAALLAGLLLVRYPLAGGLPLLAITGLGSAGLLLAGGLHSPLTPLPQRVTVLPLQLTPDGVGVEVRLYDAVGSELAGSLHRLPGNALRLEWAVSELSPWLLPMRPRVALPVALHSGVIPHDSLDAFLAAGSASLLNYREYRGFLPPRARTVMGQPWYPRLFVPRELEFSW